MAKRKSFRGGLKIHQVVQNVQDEINIKLQIVRNCSIVVVRIKIHEFCLLFSFTFHISLFSFVSNKKNLLLVKNYNLSLKGAY